MTKNTAINKKSKQDRALAAVLTKAHAEFEKGMRSHAYYKVHDEAITEDLVQETFTKTWSYLVREGKIDMMRPFLYHILNCLIIDEYRKHKHESLDALLDKGFEPGSESVEKMYFAFDAQLAAELIKKLPLNYRRTIYMRYIEELSLPEISQITGQTKNTIAVQSHRGLDKLKKIYRSHKGEIG